MTTKSFDSIIMLRFDKTKVGNKKFVDVCNIVISRLIEAKSNSKY